MKTTAIYEKTKPPKASLQEVAEFLGVHYSTIVRWDKARKELLRYGLPVVKAMREAGTK